MATTAVDRSYIVENANELRRLRALVERLSDADLARPTPGGWTVAASLAHVAFWDQRILFWLDRWESGESPRHLHEADIDWVNDAGKPLCLALPPRVAARLTVEIAEDLDRRLAALPDEASPRTRRPARLSPDPRLPPEDAPRRDRARPPVDTGPPAPREA
jgi:hypothetical protein